MPPEMWLPLALNVVGVYCLFAANLLGRLRVEILRRESGTSWVQQLVRSNPA